MPNNTDVKFLTSFVRLTVEQCQVRLMACFLEAVEHLLLRIEGDLASLAHALVAVAAVRVVAADFGEDELVGLLVNVEVLIVAVVYCVDHSWEAVPECFLVAHLLERLLRHGHVLGDSVRELDKFFAEVFLAWGLGLSLCGWVGPICPFLDAHPHDFEDIDMELLECPVLLQPEHAGQEALLLEPAGDAVLLPLADVEHAHGVVGAHVVVLISLAHGQGQGWFQSWVDLVEE